MPGRFVSCFKSEPVCEIPDPSQKVCKLPQFPHDMLHIIMCPTYHADNVRSPISREPEHMWQRNLALIMFLDGIYTQSKILSSLASCKMLLISWDVRKRVVRYSAPNQNVSGVKLRKFWRHRAVHHIWRWRPCSEQLTWQSIASKPKQKDIFFKICGWKKICLSMQRLTKFGCCSISYSVVFGQVRRVKLIESTVAGQAKSISTRVIPRWWLSLRSGRPTAILPSTQCLSRAGHKLNC